MSTDRLLIAEDEVRIADLFRMIAEECGYEVRIAGNAATFKNTLRAFEPTLISLDLAMPGVHGIELLRFLAESGCRAKILIASGLARDVVAAAERRARDSGLDITGTIAKPIRMADLRTILHKLRAPEG